MSAMPKKRADRELEDDVKKGVKDVLTNHGWWWWMPPANMYGKDGISDFHAVKDHLFMAIETKRGSGPPKPTANQIGFLQQVRGNGHWAFVVNAPRVAILDQFLSAFDSSTAAVKAKQMPPTADGATMIDAIRVMQQEF